MGIITGTISDPCLAGTITFVGCGHGNGVDRPHPPSSRERQSLFEQTNLCLPILWTRCQQIATMTLIAKFPVSAIYDRELGMAVDYPYPELFAAASLYSVGILLLPTRINRLAGVS